MPRHPVCARPSGGPGCHLFANGAAVSAREGGDESPKAASIEAKGGGFGLEPSEPPEQGPLPQVISIVPSPAAQPCESSRSGSGSKEELLLQERDEQRHSRPPRVCVRVCVCVRVRGVHRYMMYVCRE